MSNNYASFYVPPSSLQYNNVSSQIIGPLTSSQSPNVSGVKNLGVLNGVHPNPPKFYPADSTGDFSNARLQYSKTANSIKQQMIARARVLESSRPNTIYSMSTQRPHSVSTHTNYIPPQDSSLYISSRKSKALGKSSYKQGLPAEAPLSFKNYNRNDTNHALKRARSGGCVAPPKCGSIFNKSCTKSTCNNSVQTPSPILPPPPPKPTCGTIIDISTICTFFPKDHSFPCSYRLNENTTISECQILLLSDDMIVGKISPVVFLISEGKTLTNNGKIIMNTINFEIVVAGTLINNPKAEIYNKGSSLINASVVGGKTGTITNNGTIYNYNGGGFFNFLACTITNNGTIYNYNEGIFASDGTYTGSDNNFVNADGGGSCGTGTINGTTSIPYITGCPPLPSLII